MCHQYFLGGGGGGGSFRSRLLWVFKHDLTLQNWDFDDRAIEWKNKSEHKFFGPRCQRILWSQFTHQARREIDELTPEKFSFHEFTI